MINRAAIRWVTRGPNKPPIIQYMLLDSNLEYLIYPKEHEVRDIAPSIKAILEEFEKKSGKIPLRIYYKSVNVSYGAHRRDSGQFHRLLKEYLAKKKLLISNARLAFLLKKDQLKLFKNALYFLDIDCKSRGNAFITHLWAIALKATHSRVPMVIKQIWKARYCIHRMNQTYEKDFQAFYSHFA